MLFIGRKKVTGVGSCMGGRGARCGGIAETARTRNFHRKMGCLEAFFRFSIK